MNRNDLQDFENLPQGWEVKSLGEALPLSYGKGLKKTNRIKTGKFAVYGSSGLVGIHSISLTNKPALIIGRKGSVGEIYFSPRPCWPIDTTYYVEEKNGLYLPFFLYLLKGLRLGRFDKSTAIPGLSRDDYNSIKVVVAPLSIQKQVVGEIEKQFSRLDEAVTSLKRAKANLKRYKAAILKAAVEGRLTEQWRKEHPDVEPAEKLLQRILAERRTKWEQAELAKMKGKGKKPEEGDWRKKYQEPTLPGTIGFEVPGGWTLGTIKQLSRKVQYGTSSKAIKEPGGVPILRMGNIVEGELSFDDLKYLPDDHLEFPEILLEPGDLLFNRTNSPELVGKSAVFDGVPKPCSFASYLIRIQFLSGVEPKLISYFLNSVHGRQWIKSVVSQQVGQANVNGTKLQSLSVPLPPLPEQKEIISIAESRLSIVYRLEREVEINLRRSERLRQSILKKAFSGQLLRNGVHSTI